MSKLSVNIKLIPSSGAPADYTGYYLIVSYDYSTGSDSTFNSERVVCDDQGRSRFFIPDSSIVDNVVRIEVHSPDGLQVHNKLYTTNALLTDPAASNIDDSSTELTITVPPHSPILTLAGAQPTTGKIKGKVIDLFGQTVPANLQVILWAADDANQSFNVNTFVPIYSGFTDNGGYFSGSYDLDDYTACYATINSKLDKPLPVALNNHLLPKHILLAIELSKKKEDNKDCGCMGGPVSYLPDHEDLTGGTGSYSQDLGGQCVNFTIPNRTLEEFEFCALVRTTEPEIRKHTITEAELIKVRGSLQQAAGSMLGHATKFFEFVATARVNSSLLARLNENESPASPPAVAGRTDLKLARDLNLDENVAGPARNIPLSSASIRQASAAAQDVAFKLSMLLDEQTIVSTLKTLQDKIGNAQQEFVKKLKEIINFTSNTENFKFDKFEDLVQQIGETVALGEQLLSFAGDFEAYYIQYGEVSTFGSDVYSKLPGLRLELSTSLKMLQDVRSRLVKSYTEKHASRVELDVDHSIDWDEDPTVYQATTIAHGHIVCFKMIWKADGYSLGEVKYSMSLGPCQKKQIAVVDWDRRETALRKESLTARESMDGTLSHNRDVNEVISGALTERTTGRSLGATMGESGGGGGSAIYQAFAGVVGQSHSIGVAGSFASQNGTRSFSGNTMNRLREQILQSASTYRSQNSTVVQAMSQHENMRVQTEVIANKNLCHSVNYMFFEVLRHFVIQIEMCSVRECLFIPLQITPFDINKALRWKDTLIPFLADPELRLGFDALLNISQGTPSPNRLLADETIDDFNGHLKISFEIPMPSVSDVPLDASGGFTDSFMNDIRTKWGFWYNNFLAPTFGFDVIPFFRAYFWRQSLDAQLKHWEENLMPLIVEKFIRNLKIDADNGGGVRTPLELDITQLSSYKRGQWVDVSINFGENTPAVFRSSIKRLIISSGYQVPARSNIIVRSGALTYRTASLNETLFDRLVIDNDMSNSDKVIILTPLNERETVNAGKNEVERANRLLDFLNDNLELAHRIIWMKGIDASRRYMTLDGLKLAAAGGRSVASIVENQVVDIIGNCLVMPVAAGLRIDPVFRTVDDLKELYQPEKPHPPFRLSLPTKGCFMEAIQGSCNACEELDYSKARFHGFECKDEPTAIQPVSVETRRADPPNMTAKDLPANIVNFQTAPSAPTPTGFGDLLTLLGGANSFRDLTGLTENQKNAIAALQTDAANAQAFARMAKELNIATSMQKNAANTIDQIRRARDKGDISQEQASVLIEEALRSSIQGNTEKSTDEVEPDDTSTTLVGSSGFLNPTFVVRARLDLNTLNFDPATNQVVSGGPVGASTDLLTLLTVLRSNLADVWDDNIPPSLTKDDYLWVGHHIDPGQNVRAQAVRNVLGFGSIVQDNDVLTGDVSLILKIDLLEIDLVTGGMTRRRARQAVRKLSRVFSRFAVQLNALQGLSA